MTLTKEQEAALARLKLIVPHLRLAAMVAKLRAPKVQLGVLAVQAAGEGSVVAQFDADEFLKDLEVFTEFEKGLQEIADQMKETTGGEA